MKSANIGKLVSSSAKPGDLSPFPVRPSLDSRLRPWSDGNGMTKIKKSAAELEMMILSELHAHPKCAGVSMVTIRWARPEDRVDGNWKIGHVNYGTSLREDCIRPIAQIEERLHRQFDLA